MKCFHIFLSLVALDNNGIIDDADWWLAAGHFSILSSPSSTFTLVTVLLSFISFLTKKHLLRLPKFRLTVKFQLACSPHLLAT